MLKHAPRIVSSRPLRRRRSGTTILALISVFFSTSLAFLTVPHDLRDPSALFEPTLIMTVGLLLPVALQVRTDLRSLLRIENLVMVGLVYWLLLDMLQSAYSFKVVTRTDVQQAFGIVGLFAAFVWIGAWGRGWELPGAVKRGASTNLSDQSLFVGLIVSFLFGMAKYAIGAGFDPILMIQGLGMPRWAAPWSRGQFGGADAIVDHLQYFGYLVPSMTVVLAVRKGWLRWPVLFGLLFTIIILPFLAQGGGRRVVGVALGAAFLTWMAARPTLRPQTFLFGVPAILGILIFLQEMLRYRNVGFTAWWRGERPELRVSHLHVDDNFLRLSQLISFYPERVDFVYHQPLYHALTLPVPRFLWPGKPTGAGFDIAALVDKQGVALSSSILGELWVSLGVVAIMAGGLVIGRLAGMWNKILSLPYGPARPLVYGLGVMVAFAGLRSMQAMVQMSYIVLAYLIVIALIRKRTPKFRHSS